jgi:hypothetical protein
MIISGMPKGLEAPSAPKAASKPSRQKQFPSSRPLIIVSGLPFLIQGYGLRGSGLIDST